LQFEISHEFDAPLDAVELAVLSPDLGPMMARLLKTMLESVETIEHDLKHGELRRVLRFQANAPLAIFRNVNVAREVMSWEEESVYRLSEHASKWTALPRVEWRRYFHSQGTYKLSAVPDGRTRRTVWGELWVKAGVLSSIIERMAIVEIRKTYDAEAETLRKLSIL